MFPFILAVVQTASAWTTQTVPGSDTEVWWASMPLEYTVVDSDLPANSDAAIKASFAAWSDVDGSQAGFASVRDDAAKGVAANDEQQVVFVESDWRYGDNVLAIAAVWSDEASGELLHFDVRLNGALGWSVDGTPGTYDLESALTHEVGHVLGLDHTELEEATMFAELQKGVLRRGLHDDDEEGLRHLYPLAEAGMGCSTAPAAAGLWSVFALLGLRRRR